MKLQFPEKYRINQFSKDVGLKNKEVSELLAKFGFAAKTSMGVLDPKEFNILLAFLTISCQTDNILRNRKTGADNRFRKKTGFSRESDDVCRKRCRCAIRPGTEGYAATAESIESACPSESSETKTEEQTRPAAAPVPPGSQGQPCLRSEQGKRTGGAGKRRLQYERNACCRYQIDARRSVPV